MKTPQIHTILLCVGVLSLANVHAADPVSALLIEAKAAYQSGDFDKAKAKCQTITQIDPKNQAALGFLKTIEADEAKRGGNQQGQLAKLVVPSVKLREASLPATLEYLRQAVAKMSDGKQTVNFVLQLPTDQANTKTVTIDLTNIPFPELLKYVGALTNVDFVYDKYAILVKPQATTAAQ